MIANSAVRAMTMICAGVLLVGAAADTNADDDARPVDYLRDVKPILAAQCSKCHGDENQENGLRLDSAKMAIKGGDSGPAVVMGKAAESLLVKALRGEGGLAKMPPKGPGLSEQQIAVIEKWINQGAKFPKDELAALRASHWAFQAPLRPRLPSVQNAAWPRTAIDYFILARLDDEGLRPSPPADRATLIRRLSLDLRGIPPSVEEVEQFVGDERPDAYESLIDRLLASPMYGERWGRHWLDAARYADSNGFTRDFGREIWKYREWVIAAVNDDMPFDQFTVEQFAGDMLPDASLDQLIATGFHRNTLINEEGGTDQEQFRVDAVADRVATTGVVFLGLTLECARCHEHKYDPISQREYYQVFAFLNNCDEPQVDAPAAWQVEEGWLDRRAEMRKRIDGFEKKLADSEPEVLAKQLAWEKTITPEQRSKLPGPLQAALDKTQDERDDEQKKLVRDHFKTTDEARAAFPAIDEIARLRDSEPKIPTTMVMRQRSSPRETHVHRRGNFLDPGSKVEPTVPAVLHALKPASEQPNRLDFARWLVDPQNPLTPRVILNRHWQHFFGRGIVETENDFGTQGTPPSHPKLLDWLADEFVRRGWNVKEMHRLIVTSAVYRQSSRLTSELLAVDPQNKWLARQSRVRLEAEIVRDAALAASGLLTTTIGGPSVFPPQPEGVFDFTQDPKPWKTETGGDRYRRGMYTHFWRSSPYPALMAFDAPDANTTCTRRVRSNTPLQALVAANDVTFVECAQSLADRLLAQADKSDSERIRLAFRICMSREPDERVVGRLLQFVENQRASFAANAQAAGDSSTSNPDDISVERLTWTALSRVLLNLDEFITRE